VRDKPLKIYVAGHRGMVGAAIVRELQARHCEEGASPTRQSTVDRHAALAMTGVEIITRTHAELDLTNQAQSVNSFKPKNPIRSTSLPRRSAAFMPMTHTQPSSFTKT